MPKPWDFQLERRKQVRSPRRYLVVSEDSKSSLLYLKAFKIPEDVAEIVTEGGAGNTDDVVTRAIEMRDHAITNHQPFIHTWCVIDRDEHPANKYARAFDLARNYDDITVIWANESFELWYLLHFCYRITGIGRAEIIRELGKREYLGRKYSKGDATIYEALKDKQGTALRNSRRLLRESPNPKHNPSTNIHLLVEKLNALRGAFVEG